MAKYRKKPIVVDATQWWRNGDHPEDASDYTRNREGIVVRRYRNSEDAGGRNCEKCGRTMHDHGWIDIPDIGHIVCHIVCPGDWIVTGVRGECYPCKPDIFEATFELVEGGE